MVKGRGSRGHAKADSALRRVHQGAPLNAAFGAWDEGRGEPAQRPSANKKGRCRAPNNLEGTCQSSGPRCAHAAAPRGLAVGMRLCARRWRRTGRPAHKREETWLPRNTSAAQKPEGGAGLKLARLETARAAIEGERRPRQGEVRESATQAPPTPRVLSRRAARGAAAGRAVLSRKVVQGRKAPPPWSKEYPDHRRCERTHACGSAQGARCGRPACSRPGLGPRVCVPGPGRLACGWLRHVPARAPRECGVAAANARRIKGVHQAAAHTAVAAQRRAQPTATRARHRPPARCRQRPICGASPRRGPSPIGCPHCRRCRGRPC
jgi:hypothetical protein